jgi:hypothetical protein
MQGTHFKASHLHHALQLLKAVHALRGKLQGARPGAVCCTACHYAGTPKTLTPKPPKDVR